jgi:hypothetical protein
VTRRALLALAAAAALAGCPLPQPLPDYPSGTAIPPPRILVDGILLDGASSSARAVVLVPAGCATEPVYPLTADVLDTNTIETVEAHWFVNYHASSSYIPVKSDTVPPDPDPLVLTRTVPPEGPFEYRAYYHLPPVGSPPPPGPPYDGAGLVRVVELVVSNGFDSTATNWPAATLPNRTPRLSFETQVYRWVFLTVPETTGSCTPGTDPVCVKCP